MSEISNFVDVNITKSAVRLVQEGFGSILVLSRNTNLAEGITVIDSTETFESEVGADSAIGEALKSIVYLAFSQDYTVPQIKVKKVVDGDSVVDAYNDALLEAIENEVAFYGILTDISDSDISDETNEISNTDIEDIAATAEANSKFFMFSTSQSDVFTDVSTDIFSTLKSSEYEHTLGFAYKQTEYTEDSTDYVRKPEAALMSKQFAKAAGSSNWKYQQLKGFPADELTATEITNITGKNAMFFEEVAGLSLTTGEGLTFSGEYADIVRGIDWMTARVGENVFRHFVEQEKIPYNNAGITSIETVINEVLDSGVGAPHFFINSYDVSVPEASEVTTGDRLARLLDNVTFEAELSGAINKTKIVGKLTV